MFNITSMHLLCCAWPAACCPALCCDSFGGWPQRCCERVAVLACILLCRDLSVGRDLSVKWSKKHKIWYHVHCRMVCISCSAACDAYSPVSSCDPSAQQASSAWAARYNTWLLIELTPKDVVCSVLLFCFVLFCFVWFCFVLFCFVLFSRGCLSVQAMNGGLGYW